MRKCHSKNNSMSLKTHANTTLVLSSLRGPNTVPQGPLASSMSRSDGPVLVISPETHPWRGGECRRVSSTLQAEKTVSFKPR